MLQMMARWAGRRAAAFAALAYLGCVLMPSVALALVPGAVSAYCFDEIAEEVAALKSAVHMHVHSDGTVHYHHQHGGPTASAAQHAHGEDHGAAPAHSHPPGTHDASCCGVFGFTAVLPVLNAAIAEPAAYHIQQPIPTECLVGCSPSRIDRPPIVALPV
jgi:hypothetical protein